MKGGKPCSSQKEAIWGASRTQHKTQSGAPKLEIKNPRQAKKAVRD